MTWKGPRWKNYYLDILVGPRLRDQIQGRLKEVVEFFLDYKGFVTNVGINFFCRNWINLFWSWKICSELEKFLLELNRLQGWLGQ